MDIEFKEKRIICKGTSINYVDRGEGVVMLFLHHGGGFWQTWSYQLTHFVKTHRVIAFDWPEFGSSSTSNRSLDLDSLYTILKNFVEQLDLNQFHLVSHCIGGSAAILYRQKHREQVLSLTVLNLCPGNRYVKNGMLLTFIHWINNSTILHWIISRLFKFYFFIFYVLTKRYPKLLFGSKIEKTDPLYLKFEDLIRTNKQKDGLLKLLYSIDSFGIDYFYSNETVVDTLIWGDQNKVTELQTDGRYFQSAVNHSSFHVLNNTGHLSMYESPDEFNNIVAQNL